MICSSCQNAEAVVFIKTILGNKVGRQALCADCAAETQPAAPSADPLEGLLSGLPSFLKLLRPAPRGKPLRCDGCGMAYAEFRQTGRLGCPACYDSFEPYLKSIIPRIHGGATSHRGLRPD
ncbi:MAG: hypothetical protein HY927_09570 [Elusimicrobia bacterium]|nr:hypothetical protein [Elusimicrobiota bacterium]